MPFGLFPHGGQKFHTVGKPDFIDPVSVFCFPLSVFLIFCFPFSVFHFFIFLVSVLIFFNFLVSCFYTNLVEATDKPHLPPNINRKSILTLCTSNTGLVFNFLQPMKTNFSGETQSALHCTLVYCHIVVTRTLYFTFRSP